MPNGNSIQSGKTLKNSTLLLDLDFGDGIAAYSAYVCTPHPTNPDKWKVAQILTREGKSTDAQLDSFEFNGPGAGAKLMIFVSAEMTLPSPQGDVELKGSIKNVATSKEIVQATQGFTLQNGGKVQLELRMVVEGE